METLTDLVQYGSLAAALGIPIWLVLRGVHAKTLGQYPLYALLYAAIAWACLFVGSAFDVMLHLSDDGFYYERHECIDAGTQEEGCFEWSADPTYIVPAGQELRNRALTSTWLVGGVTVVVGAVYGWHRWRNGAPEPEPLT